MTVNTTNIFQDYVGDGVTTDFIFTFPSLDAFWMYGTVDGVLATGSAILNSDQETAPGGIFTFDVAPASSSNVVVFREADLTQLTDYPPYTRFPARDHEDALDKLTMITQQLSYEIESSSNVFEGDNPDLVDNDVALITVGIGQDPAFDPSLQYGPSAIQAKGDISSPADLSVNALGGDVSIGIAGGRRVLISPSNYIRMYDSNGFVLTETVTPANGGLEVNNQATGAGLERVLTVSDILDGDFNSDGSVPMTGNLRYNGAPQWNIVNETISGDIAIRATDPGGTERDFIFIDGSTGRISFSFLGVEVARTAPNAQGGLQANNTDTGAGFERVLTVSDIPSLGGGDFNSDGSVPMTGNLRCNGVAQWNIVNETISGDIAIRSTDPGGTERDFIFIDGSTGRISFSFLGVEVARTAPNVQGGLQANNTDTGSGFERVLTVSDIDNATVVTVDDLFAESLVTQNPTTLGVPLQITFGGAQTNTNFSIDALGAVTTLTAGVYELYCRLTTARTGTTGQCNLFVQSFINGVASGNPFAIKIEGALVTNSLTFTTLLNLAVNDILTLEIVRDAAAENTGGLYSFNSSSWGDSASAVVRLSHQEFTS